VGCPRPATERGIDVDLTVVSVPCRRTTNRLDQQPMPHLTSVLDDHATPI
jgi:hypothetical protein